MTPSKQRQTRPHPTQVFMHKRPPFTQKSPGVPGDRTKSKQNTREKAADTEDPGIGAIRHGFLNNYD